MAQFGIQKHGIFVDGLEPWVTKEILWSKINQETSGLQIVRIPRDFKDQSVRGYAFCGFDSRENAIEAKNKLNYIQLLGRNTIRIALITQSQERAPENNFIVQGLPENMDPKAFDQKISQYGVLVSSKITNKGFGHVQFLRKNDADQFQLACRNDQVEVEGKKIKAVVFAKHVPKSGEKKNLYFKDHKTAAYTKKQLEDETFKNAEAQKIQDYLSEKLTQYGKITSSVVKFSADFNKPFAFVCFEDSKAAEACFEAVNKDDSFEFAYKGWSLTKKELISSRNDPKNRDQRMIYMRGIKKTVTQSQMFQALTKTLPLLSIRLREPTLPKKQYRTQFATIITQEPNKLDYIKEALKDTPNKNQDLIDLFEQRPYITYCFPLQQHKQWLKNKWQREMGGGPFMQQPMAFNPRGQVPFPPMMFPPQMMPPMIRPPMMNQGFPPMSQFPPMYQQPMMPPGMAQQQQFPPMQQQPQQQQRGQSHGQMQQKRTYNNNYNRGQSQPNNYNNNRQQQRPQQGNRPQYNNQGRQNYNNNNNNNNRRPVQQNRAAQPPKAANIQPKAANIAPKPVQQQQPQQQMTIQNLKAKWADFKKLEGAKQVNILGSLLVPMVKKYAKNAANIQKITGMLVDLSNFTVDEIAEMIESPEDVQERVEEAEQLLSGAQ